MRKQTKKLLSWVLTGALALGMVGNVNVAKVGAEDDATAAEEPSLVVYEEEIDSWTTGGDKDCRIQIGNEWGGHAMPATLKAIEWTGIEVSFTVSKVEEAIAAANEKITDEDKKLDSVTAELGLATADFYAPGGMKTAEIAEDGTYAVSYAGSDIEQVGPYLAVRIPGLDKTVEQEGNEDGTTKNVIEFSDVTVKAIKSDLVVETDIDTWVEGGDGDCRIQIGNTWGGHDMPASFAAVKFTGFEVTFTASKVADAIAAANEKLEEGEKALTKVNAGLCFNSSEDSVSNWNVGTAGSGCVDAEIEEDGEYTVAYAGVTPAYFTNFLAVRIPELDSTVTTNDDGDSVNVIQFSDVKVKVYGYEWEEPEQPTPSGDKFYDEALWATPGIHAYISFQMNNWNYRDDYNPAKIKDNSYCNISAPAAAGEEIKATDVLLTKDGEYTIKLEGIDLSAADSFNWLSIATDLNGDTYKGIEATNVSLKVDGTAVTKDPIAKLTWKSDNNYYFMPLINIYNDGSDPEDPKPPLNDLNEAGDMPLPESSIEITFTISGLKQALQDLKDGNYVDPATGEKVKNDDIKDEDIAASKDNSQGGGGDDKKPTPTPPTTTNPPQNTNQPTTTNPPQNTNQPTKAPGTGTKLTSGKLVYKVTKAATAKKAGTLTVTGLSKAGKKAGSLSIPATATIKGYKYNVTKLGNNALKGAAAKSIALGKNIKAIPKGAFANCKKLSTLTIKAKLKSVKKGAFKGCKKTIKVKGSTAKNRKANVKLLKKKSGYKKFK